jgi:membrane protease YdiL (CAAX protease family)
MTMIVTTYPLSHYESRPLATADTDRRAWGFWSTLAWFGAAASVHLAVSILCGLGYVVWSVLTHPSAAIDWESPIADYIAIALSMTAAASVLMYAAQRAGPSALGYLGLTLPRLRHVFVGLGLLVALAFLNMGFFRLFPGYDPSPDLIREYQAILGNPVALVWFWITLAVTAPICEEIIFRGFLMRGWSESRMGAPGAIMLSSLLFTAIHVQYNLPTLATVFGLSLVFGVMRWRSGSTALTILLHMIWNVTVGLTTIWSV